MTDEQLPRVLAVLAEAGGTARSEESWGQDRMTALVLGGAGGSGTGAADPVAVMPMSQRAIQVAPGGGGGGAGRTMAAGWLSSNQFASRMGLRGQTRGTAGEWAELLPELDALLVVRRDEPSLAARWYAQTGFYEVLGIRCLYLDMESPPGGGGGGAASRYHVQVISGAEVGLWQEQMRAVYRDVYGNAGGAVVRHADFWQPALANHFYRDHYQFQVIGLWSDGAAGGQGGAEGATLMGYAVVGWSGWHSKRPRMDILELATRQWDTTVAQELIQTTSQLAWSKQVRQVRAVISVHDPYRGHLARMGFMDRWGYVMLAKWLHAQRYLDGLGAALPGELAGLAVQFAVPGEVDLTLRAGGGGGGGGAAPLRVQADARTVTRLLLDRVDVAAAVGDGTLLIPEADEQDIARLSHAFPWTPWAFHMLDYI